MKKPKVVIITVNWNKKEIMRDCLESVKKYTNYKNYNMIVSDNGSVDGANEMIKKEFKWVDLIENKKNLGFALGNNVAVKYALKKYNFDYVFLLNNDTKIIQKNWLKKMVETAESSKRIGIVGCKLIYPDGSLQFLAMNGKTYMFNQGEKKILTKEEEKEEQKVQKIRWNIGATYLVKRELIDKIGFFDYFVPYYGEEIDYCERARKNGFKTYYDPRVTIIHIRAQTIDSRKNTKDWFVMKKQSIKVELLNFPIHEIFYNLLVHFSSVFLMKRGDKISLRWNFPKRFILLLNAYWINITELPEILYKRNHRDEKIWVLK